MVKINIRRLAGNFFSLGFAQVISSLLQLLIIPFVIRKTGIENFGIIAVAQTVMIFLGTFSEFGFNKTGTREVSVNRTDRNTLSVIFSRGIYTRLFLCFISFALLFLFSFLFGFISQNFLLYVLGFSFVIGQAMMPLWFLQGLEKMRWSALTAFFSKLIFVLLVLLFINKPEHTSLYLFFMGAGMIIAGTVSTILLIRNQHLRFKKVSFAAIFRELKQGWPVTGTHLSMNIIQYSNLFILRLFTNDLLAGYFAVAEKIFFALKQMLDVFAQTVFPGFCLLVKQGKESLKVFFKKIFFPFFLLILLGSIGLYVFSPDILAFFTNEKSGKAVFILRMFCCALPVICLNLPGTLSLLAYDYREKYFLIYFMGMLVCIAANLILVPVFYSDGTLAAIFLSEIFITVSATWALNSLLKNKKTFSF